MRTPEFIDFVFANLAQRNTDDAEYRCLFFGYSDSYVYNEHERRRWQAALVLADLGAAATNDRFRYHFFAAETDPQSGAWVNTIASETNRGPQVVPGIIEVDFANVSANGSVFVYIGGKALTAGEPILI
jgi:hypothetical protein